MLLGWLGIEVVVDEGGIENCGVREYAISLFCTKELVFGVAPHQNSVVSLC